MSLSSLLPLAISSSGTSPGEALTTGLACLWTGDFWRLAFVSVTTKGQPVGPLPFLPSDRRTFHAGQAGLLSFGHWWPPSPPSDLLARHQPARSPAGEDICWPHSGWKSTCSLCWPPLPTLGGFFFGVCTVDTGRPQEAKSAAIYWMFTLALPTP